MKTKLNYMAFSLLCAVSFLLSSNTFRKDSNLNITVSEKESSDTFSIANYQGKIVILNFWASWSKASRSENKNLTRVYQKYKSDSRVVFVSVSLDTDEKNWKTAIDEDELAWKDHFCDFQKYKSPVVLKYGVSTLPKFLLFDAESVNILSSVRMEDIETALSNQLK